jgi:hypothetical protein
MLAKTKRFAGKLVRTARGFVGRRKALAALKPQDRKLITSLRSRRLTYLTTKKLASVASTCNEMERLGLQGACLEAGCALGGSSILIASLKSRVRPLFVYDVFGMIPQPTTEDTGDIVERYKTIAAGKSRGIGRDEYYGYQADLYARVLRNLGEFDIDCATHSVSLVKGLVQDTLVVDVPVAFAHVDVDWYEPVKTCLERIFPWLVPGGSIILDDYHDWGGCRKAADEYLRTVDGQFALDDRAGSMKITRI